ncbi:hypothetical protein BC830DRAFT_1089828 [Chytriomyces sp. MP71]|nr:hypothetical protein BC830DRAFT_1089828 [Chytriomyces sp. MP71]
MLVQVKLAFFDCSAARLMSSWPANGFAVLLRLAHRPREASLRSGFPNVHLTSVTHTPLPPPRKPAALSVLHSFMHQTITSCHAVPKICAFSFRHSLWSLPAAILDKITCLDFPCKLFKHDGHPFMQSLP